jgi:hypothetical protein
MHLSITLILAFGFLAASLCHFAAGAGGAEDQPQEMPEPAPELKVLQQSVGTWTADLTIMGEASKGKETCRFDMNGFWLVTDFEGSFMGAPFKGHGVTGFDASKKRFVGVWVDSSGSPLSIIEGTASADGKVLTQHTEGLDMTGKPARFRHITTFKDKDHRTFEVTQLLPDGKEQAIMSIQYTRS